ncbi:ADP-ribosylglycohydrolase family protein [Polymorphospora sp. NPDC051019]
MPFTLYAQARTALARDSLAGLSVGDALGAQFYVPGRRPADLAAGRLPDPVWEWTDDTEMACSVFAELVRAGRVDRDALAAAFADRCEPNRGYGPGAFTVLRLIRGGTPWPVAAATAFDGQGSLGNGAAMRVAPLGAYFADSVTETAAQAAASAEVTHAHPDGIAGAVAVAVAAALAARARLDGRRPSATDLVAAVAAAVDRASPVRQGLDRAGTLVGRPVAEAAYELGNGSRVTAGDTVPFTVWVAARHLDDYPAAVRACVEAGGDVDTTAAIAGGIVAAHTGVGTPGGVPDAWLAAREPLPDWVG